jgi:hypothetical protein
MDICIYYLQNVDKVNIRCAHVFTDDMDVNEYYLSKYKLLWDIFDQFSCFKRVVVYVYNHIVLVTLN